MSVLGRDSRKLVFLRVCLGARSFGAIYPMDNYAKSGGSYSNYAPEAERLETQQRCREAACCGGGDCGGGECDGGECDGGGCATPAPPVEVGASETADVS